RTGSSSSASLAAWEGTGARTFLRRQASRCLGVALLALVAFLLAALATWNVADPSFSYATDNPVTNAMGYPGAVAADIAMQFYGIAAVAALVPAVFWAIFLMRGRQISACGLRIAAWFGGSVLAAGIAGCIAPLSTWPLPTGL